MRKFVGGIILPKNLTELRYYVIKDRSGRYGVEVVKENRLRMSASISGVFRTEENARKYAKILAKGVALPEQMDDILQLHQINGKFPKTPFGTLTN